MTQIMYIHYVVFFLDGKLEINSTIIHKVKKQKKKPTNMYSTVICFSQRHDKGGKLTLDYGCNIGHIFNSDIIM